MIYHFYRITQKQNNWIVKYYERENKRPFTSVTCLIVRGAERCSDQLMFMTTIVISMLPSYILKMTIGTFGNSNKQVYVYGGAKNKFYGTCIKISTYICEFKTYIGQNSPKFCRQVAIHPAIQLVRCQGPVPHCAHYVLHLRKTR